MRGTTTAGKRREDRACVLDAPGTDSDRRATRPPRETPQRTRLLQLFRRLEAWDLAPLTGPLSPVRGSSTVRGLRRATAKVPKPTRVTASPLQRGPDPGEGGPEGAPVTPGHPAATAIRPDVGFGHAPLHPERAARLVHDGLVDGGDPRSAAKRSIAASGHRPDERRNPLDSCLGLRRPGDPGPGRALVHHGSEGARRSLRPVPSAAPAPASPSGVGAWIRHHRADVLGPRVGAGAQAHRS